jgi:hypothetical protein
LSGKNGSIKPDKFQFIIRKLKTMKKNLLVPIVVLVLGMTVLPTSIGWTQTPAVLDGTPGGETGGDGNGGFGDGPVVPLDGGLSLLLLAGGISYARKKMQVLADRG